AVASPGRRRQRSPWIAARRAYAIRPRRAACSADSRTRNAPADPGNMPPSPAALSQTEAGPPRASLPPRESCSRISARSAFEALVEERLGIRGGFQRRQYLRVGGNIAFAAAGGDHHVHPAQELEVAGDAGIDQR